MRNVPPGISTMSSVWRSSGGLMSVRSNVMSSTLDMHCYGLTSRNSRVRIRSTSDLDGLDMLADRRLRVIMVHCILAFDPTRDGFLNASSLLHQADTSDIGRQ